MTDSLTLGGEGAKGPSAQAWLRVSAFTDDTDDVRHRGRLEPAQQLRPGKRQTTPRFGREIPNHTWKEVLVQERAHFRQVKG